VLISEHAVKVVNCSASPRTGAKVLGKNNLSKGKD
jgi:hypothetical protein